MPVAIRAATRIQDMDDINVSLGAGVDEYALCWDNDTAKFVLRAPFASLLATGATVGATSQAQNFTVGVTVGSVTTPATLLQVAETSTASPRGIMSSQHSTSVDGARFHMRKSRGTNAAPVVVVSGDALGRLVASGYDGSNYLEMGGIDIVSAGTIASTRVPTEIRFLTATDAAPSVLTQRMVIDKAGNVGIGTTSPGAVLQVSSATPVVRIFDTDSQPLDGSSLGKIAFGTPSGEWASIEAFRHPSIWDDNSLLVFRTSHATGAGGDGTNLERMRIDRTGKVGINTTAPATTLHVVGAATITGGIRPAADGTTALQLQKAAGTSVLNVDTTNGRVGISTTAPGTRLDIDAGALTMKEMTAPTGVADKAMLYTKDNGSGKTQLCCKLGDDVEIVLATQA